jgi:hypothetical protein
MSSKGIRVKIQVTMGFLISLSVLFFLVGIVVGFGVAR